MKPQTARILLDESFTTSSRSEGHQQRIFFDPKDPSTACWTEELPNESSANLDGKPDVVQFCLAIGMVCTNVIITAGGGDNVSGMCCFHLISTKILTNSLILAGGIVLQI